MSAKYIFRLDDATADSDLIKWKKLEKIFNDYGIKPIVAVVPDNQDRNLKYANYNENFWDTVVSWQQNGWTIAMHGYQHLFHKVSRKKLLLPYYDRSEFGGISFNKQCKKIRSSLKIFQENNVDPEAWVAPAHSFDKTTLDALENETKIRIVSDGIALNPYYINGFYFIPQQLWSIKNKLFGIWTICLHPDTMSDEEIDNLRLQLSSPNIYKNTISIKDVPLNKSSKNFFDYVYSFFYWSRHRIANILRPIKQVLKETIKS